MPKVLVNLLQTTGTKGGIEVYARELYQAIGRRDDFEFVAYASRELARTDTGWFPGEVIDSGISGENRLTWAFGELFSVAHAARRVSADLIHGPAMFGPLRPSVPVVLSVHDLLYFSHPQLMQTSLLTEPVKWMEKRAAVHASRILTISESSGRAIRKYLGFPADRIDLIPLAARGTARPSGARSSDLFLATGQRSPYKDFETIVRAWAVIPVEQRPRLIITGGHGDDPLAPLVAELGVSDSVELKQWVPTEELNELRGTATALVDPTLAAGFSLPALEAMQDGLPVIFADTEVFREVGAGAAEYFTAGSPESLARTVLALASNPARQSELGELGRARAREFSWQKVADQTLASFTLALDDPAPRHKSRRAA